MRRFWVFLFITIALLSPSGPTTAQTPEVKPNPTVFIILLENHNWAQIKGSASAPYINRTLLPKASYTEQYYNPPNVHPSEPNYIWLEAGTDFGIRDDADPRKNHQSTTLHLVTLLAKAGISWKIYLEGIDGYDCPLVSFGRYAAKHNPMIFFDDVTDTNSAKSRNCITHMRPYRELEADLKQGRVARYNFIVPDVCHDMHDSIGCETPNSIKNGDNWLSAAVPPILKSTTYQESGILFITWDEGEGSDGPIGMLVLSQFAKGGGYSNKIRYTHSSTLRTLQEIFGVMPFLGDAQNAADLSDLFREFPQGAAAPKR